MKGKLANSQFTIFKGQDNSIYVEMISRGFINPNLSIANIIQERISNYVVICETVKKIKCSGKQFPGNCASNFMLEVKVLLNIHNCELFIEKFICSK